MRKLFQAFSAREKRILFALAAAPVFALLLPNVRYLFMLESRAAAYFDIAVVSGVLVLLLLATLIVCAVKNQWKLLWPLLVFCVLPVVSNLFTFVEMQLGGSALTRHGIHFVYLTATTLITVARHACIWLTVYLVARHFKTKQQTKSQLEENLDA